MHQFYRLRRSDVLGGTKGMKCDMGYVEAAKAVWKLYTLHRWTELEDIGLSKQTHKPMLDEFLRGLGRPTDRLTGFEALVLLIKNQGVLEASQRLLELYEQRKKNETLPFNRPRTHRRKSTTASKSKSKRSTSGGRNTACES